MNLAGVVRARWLLARNTLWGRGASAPAARRRTLLSAGLSILLALLVFIALTALFQAMAAAQPPTAAGGVLALVLTAAIVGLIVFDLHYAVTTLLLDPDLELLRRAPVPPGFLLLLKLCDALPRTSTLLVVLALPALLAFGTAYHLPAWAWLMIPFQLAALWLGPLGAGVALALFVIRRVPATRAREVLGLLSTFALAGLWIANSFLLPRLASDDGDFAVRVGETLDPWQAASLSPGTWLANALIAATDGEIGEAVLWTVVLGGAAFAAVGWAVWTARRDLEEALLKAFTGSLPGRPRRIADRAPRVSVGRGRQVRALLLRDRRLLGRDWTVLSDVVTGAALWTLLPLVGAPLHSGSPVFLAQAMLLTLTVGLGYEVAARAVPFERAGIVWARLAPVPAEKWIAAKLAGAMLLSLPLVAVAAISLAWAIPLSAAQWFETLAVSCSALVLSLSLGLWSGVQFGDLQWTNPRAMLSLPGRLVATFLLIGQVVLWLVLLGIAERAPRGMVFGISLWGPGLALVASVLPIWGAKQRLSRFEWSY